MERLELSRSKAKHPAAKVSVEARKVKAKVEKSDTNRRRKNMEPNDPRNLRLAELRAESEERNRKGQDVKLSNDAQSMRQRIENLAAKDLPDRAEKLAARENIDYGAAVRQIIADDDAFQHLPESGPVPDGGDGLAQIVAERMAADPEGYRHD